MELAARCDDVALPLDHFSKVQLVEHHIVAQPSLRLCAGVDHTTHTNTRIRPGLSQAPTVHGPTASLPSSESRSCRIQRPSTPPAWACRSRQPQGTAAARCESPPHACSTLRLCVVRVVCACHAVNKKESFSRGEGGGASVDEGRSPCGAGTTHEVVQEAVAPVP